jgi:hypothetical protein
MAAMSFLFDQHTPRWWIENLLREELAIVATVVGAIDGPQLGTGDADLLIFCEEHKMALVTCDKRTMFQHIADHYAAGREFWGMFLITGSLQTEDIVFQLRLHWATTTAEEFVGVVQELPM